MQANRTIHHTGMMLVIAFACILVTPVDAQTEGITYRLTIQIHEGPGFNSFYLFYTANFQLPDGDGSSRQVDILVPHGDEMAEGFSAHPLDNATQVTLEVGEAGGETRLRVTTNGSEFEVRYYIPSQARVLKNDDLQVIFPPPRVEDPLRGMTVAINWPNWKYQIHKIVPEGAEMVMNPMFETDPYKSVSYYWYFSSSEANDVRMDEISVTLRTASTVSRVNRNQTILILLAVVCIPTVIFVAINPPKKMKTERLRMSAERQRKFRITDERDIRAKRRREKYKSG